MKKIFIPILFLSVLSLGIGYAMVTRASNPLNIQSSQILNRNHPIYKLKLKSNRTTGYSWFIMNYDHNLLHLKNHRYVTAQNQGMVGAGGYEIFTFQATSQALKAPHTTTIKMIYVRPWEMKKGQIPASAQIKTFTVNIR